MNDEEVMEKVLEKINKAKGTLSLNQMWISKLPDEIKDIKNLTRLELNFNEIKELPEFICGITTLNHIKLKGNRIKKLPDNIGNLKELKSIDLEGNAIEMLPESFTELENLEELILESCNLKALPESIGKLKNLKILDLGKCHLTELPESFSELKQLQKLNLSLTKLKKIPSFLGKLEKLEELHLLSVTDLTEIPDELNELSSLKVLLLSGMKRVDRFPENLSGLLNLENLMLNELRLKIIPEGVFTVPALKYLRCERNSLTEIPFEIIGMKKLESIFFSGNSVTKIPEFLKEKELVNLDLSYNDIDENSFPDNFGDFKIENLTFNFTPLSELKKAPKNLSKNQTVKIKGVKFRLNQKESEELIADFCDRMKDMNPEYIKEIKDKYLSEINKTLVKWGGEENKLSSVNDFQSLFLKELFDNEIKKLYKNAKESFQDFFGDRNLKFSTEIQEIKMPDPKNNAWEITINNGDLVGPLIIYKMDGWNVSEEHLLG